MGLHEGYVAAGVRGVEGAPLAAIRAHIDAHGDDLRRVIDAKAFRERFGDLLRDGQLKTAPRGYDRDHEYVDLLRLKSYAVTRPVSQAEAKRDDFIDEIVEDYRGC